MSSGAYTDHIASAETYARITSLRQQLSGWFHLSRSVFGEDACSEQPHFATVLFSNIILMYY